MKTYVLTVSRQFPTTHKRVGDRTFFPEKILVGQGGDIEPKLIEEFGELLLKLHTIRANYELWAKRIKEVQEGKAILSIRYWSGKPYNSKQVEICQLNKDSGCGVQKLEFGQIKGSIIPMFEGMSNRTTCIELAKNDGLSLEDFKEWFKSYDLSKPMAIIHFTSFRY